MSPQVSEGQPSDVEVHLEGGFLTQLNRKRVCLMWASPPPDLTVDHTPVGLDGTRAERLKVTGGRTTSFAGRDVATSRSASCGLNAG